MSLSTNAQHLLDLLDAGGRPANLSRLRAQVAVDGDFEQSMDELVGAGLVTRVGKGGRLARVGGEARALSLNAQMLLAALPEDGSTVGNYSLRSELALDDETYASAKRELRSAGLLTVGVGYGGTVARATSVPRDRGDESRSLRRGVAREHELYEPFVRWLRSSLEDQDLAFAEARVTATPKGYRRGGGKWSRPDATAVQVFRYECLPEIRVEVSSYEIKRSVDSENLEIVYEAAAHGRWAHRASLVVEQVDTEKPVPPAVFDEVSRFRLGLYTMEQRSDGTFDIRERVQPPLTHESQPEDLNDLLTYFLRHEKRIRDAYMRAIGR